MLNRIMLSTMSLATLTIVVTWPITATAMIRPLSTSEATSGATSRATSIQLSSGHFNNSQFTDQSSDDLSGLMITGCSHFGSGGPQVCLQWLGDALTTCLEWGDDSVITACMQKGKAIDEEDGGGYTTSSAGQNTSQNDWGFSLEFTLQ